MRVLGREETPLTIVDLDTPGVIAVNVPSIGHLMVRAQSDGTWIALLVQIGGAQRARDVAIRDDRVEVELLPNSSQEERLVVVIRGLVLKDDE